MERLPSSYEDHHDDHGMFGFAGAHSHDAVHAGADEHYDDHADEPGHRDDDRAVAAPARTRRRPRGGGGGRGTRRYNRVFGWAVALAVILLLAGVAWVGARSMLGMDYADYEGSGDKDLVVHVEDGDSTSVIAGKLLKLDAVASTRAFLVAAENDDDIRGVRPGYYVVKSQMSGAKAVDAITDPKARVGQLEIRSGTQLDDLHQPNGALTNGILTKLSLASCAKLNGKSTCVPVEQLRAEAAKADLVALGAPEWMASVASKAPPERRLEGLVMPGLYDIKPGWSAKQLLTEVLTTSRIRLETAGLPDGANAMKLSPYETVVVASIIEREAVENDFRKVSRVIYNRLAKGMRLEMDSTINYVLDRPEVRTKSTDRARAGAYNTYRNNGLPPTPISAPSMEALAAAQSPEAGEWVFFVKCEKNGLSCFAVTLEDHQRNIREAQARGAY